MKFTTKKILEKLNNDKYKIKSFGIKKMWLFGSYATNKQTENSDIDFLLEFDKTTQRKYKKIRELKEYLENENKVKIDLGLKSDINPIFKKEILNSNLIEIKI